MANRMILNETSYFGKGAIENIVTELQARGFKKPVVITDKDLIQFEVATKVTTLLDKANITYTIFDGVVPNPTIQNVKDGVAAVKAAEADVIIAIGGGSPIDTAKAIGVITTNPEFEDVISLEGVAETRRPCLPILAVPTTSGTAAEVTINYVITDENHHRKFVCVDPHDIPIVAFVDSDMMMGMPKSLAAATGMDALTHAIEGYITKGAWEMTDMLHIKAIEIIGNALRASVLDEDQKAREDMALGQYIAGMGFSNVGLGLVHGMAHPLSAWYNIPHGVACASLLPTVMRFNKAFSGEKYRDIAKAMGVAVDGISIEEIRDIACNTVDKLGEDVGIPRTISELGVKAKDIADIAKDAFKDVCTPGNPRDATVEEIAELYRSLL
ncbi:lactaldehyde reductase [Lactococcus hodotermopsidis]|uniref:Lactaldehyde reductase n=1 Tax=Pseudolactococcus hodotermopsidis TaxID=2709157 RepID=A0A6A0BA51_9LACT|nr:lactaldehyde reductase [Lactococcus hodotermopsidis]GFH41513.1 lactaldehyde reductase [Lactococcus hodotermopsidis]